MRKLLLATLTLALTLSLVQAQEATDYDPAIRAARTTAWNAITKGKGSGASIAMMVKGKFIFSEGIGVGDRALNNPVDRDTRFNIGSIAKVFTTVAVLLLVDDGKVSLDDPVVKYIPDFKMKDERYKEITVRMLLDHSSGFPGSSFVMSFAPEDDFHKVLLETLAQDHLKHAPGAVSMYCNDGFTLAEILVERVSGQPFMDFLDRRVLQPLAMHETGVSLGELPTQTPRAEAYDGSARRYPAEVVEVHGAGGLSSTAEDLCRFANSFTPFGTNILSKKSLKEIRTARNTPFGSQLQNRPIYISLGWDYSDLNPYEDNGLKILGKAGNTALYSGNLQVLPDQGLAIAFLISGNATGEALTRPILLELLDVLGLAQKESLPAARPFPQQLFPDDFGPYEGYYVGEASGAFKVSLSEDRMHLNVVPLNSKESGGSGVGEPLYSFSYSDGLLFEPNSKLTLYVTTIDDTRYIVTTPGPGEFDLAALFSADLPAFQQLKEVRDPLHFVQDDGKPWLVRNIPASTVVPMFPLLVEPATYSGLDGYIDFAGLKRVESSTYASVAATHFRDQTEMELWKDEGIDWARTSNLIYSHTAPAKSKQGENSVSIGPKGYNEWLELQEDALVKFENPSGGRTVVLSPGQDILFDSLLDTGVVFVPKESLVFCAGPAGSNFTLTLEH